MTKNITRNLKNNITISSQSFPLRQRLILKKMFLSILCFLLLLSFLFDLYGSISDPFVIFASAGAAILLVVALGHHISLKVFYYEIEDEFIIIKRHAIVPKEITIEYSRIQEIVVFRDLFDKMFGLYQLKFKLSLTSVYGAKMAYIEGLDEVEAHELKVVIDKMMEKSRKRVR